MNRCRLLGQLERGFLEFTFGHYPTPNRYPMVAARLVAAGEVGSRLAELAGLSENAPESEIRELLMAIGEDFAWTPETHSSGVRRLFAFWACAVGSELDAAEFARRSRIGIVRENFALPSYDWVEWLVGLESEWDEINRPRDVVEADIAVFAQELCAEEGLAGGCTCTDLG